MMNNIEETTAKLFFNAAFPVMKVVLEDAPGMKAKFKDVKALVQFTAKNGAETLAAYLVFDKGDFSVVQGVSPDKPDITLSFPSLEKMNTMFRGGSALPSIKGWSKPVLLVKVFTLLMALMLMSPKAARKIRSNSASKSR